MLLGFRITKIGRALTSRNLFYLFSHHYIGFLEVVSFLTSDGFLVTEDSETAHSLFLWLSESSQNPSSCRLEPAASQRKRNTLRRHDEMSTINLWSPHEIEIRAVWTRGGIVGYERDVQTCGADPSSHRLNLMWDPLIRKQVWVTISRRFIPSTAH